MKELAWINGKVSGLAEAQVSFLDRGFLFGDGVYEVIRIYNGVPFALDLHLERLEKSMAAINVHLHVSNPELKSIIHELITESRLLEAQVYIQVTRGVALRQHAFPAGTSPTLAIYLAKLRPINPQDRVTGVKAITVPDIRWSYCHIKSLNLLPNVLAKESAVNNGATEAIFVRDGGQISEGSSSNVFAVIGGMLVTPPRDGHILEGITRKVCLELAEVGGVMTKEEVLTSKDLYLADEVFITGTIIEILPVVEIDGKPIGRRSPGPVSTEIYQSYQKIVNATHCTNVR